MSSTFAENIEGQPDALRGVVELYGSSQGRGLLDEAREVFHRRAVVSSGMGASLFALLATRRLLDSAMPGHVIEETGYLSENLPHVSRRPGALLLVSQSGETVESRVLQGLAPELPTVALTRNGESSIGTAADVVLPMACPADLSVAIQTYTSTVAVLALLAAHVGAGDVPALLDDIARTADVVERETQRLGADIVAVADHVAAAQQIYAVGRGASVGTALGTGLLLKEAAKRNCEGSASAQFRHGAVEVISSDTAVVVFTGDQPGVRQLDVNLVNELLGYGAPVVVVGPEHDEMSDGACFVKVPTVPDALRPIIEILPMQLLSAELAARNDVVPGDFRNTVPVIATA